MGSESTMFIVTSKDLIPDDVLKLIWIDFIVGEYNLITCYQSVWLLSQMIDCWCVRGVIWFLVGAMLKMFEFPSHELDFPRCRYCMTVYYASIIWSENKLYILCLFLLAYPCVCSPYLVTYSYFRRWDDNAWLRVDEWSADGNQSCRQVLNRLSCKKKCDTWFIGP